MLRCSRWRILSSPSRERSRSRSPKIGWRNHIDAAAAARVRDVGRELAMARSSKLSDARLIELFLDMLAAERGAAKNTLQAYARDLADFSAYLAAGVGALGRAPALGDPPALPVSLSRGSSRRQSGRRDRRSEARPSAAENPVDRRSRSPARGGPRRARARGRAAQRKAPRGAAHLPARSPIRDGIARLRARGAAGVGGLARRAGADGARQGRQGAAGAVERRRQAGDGGISGLAPRRGRSGEKPVVVSLVRRERPPDAPAFRPRAQDAGGSRGTAARGPEPPCAAACVRQPFAAERRRFALGPDAARPCRYLDDADLYSRARRAPQEPGARSASAGARLNRRRGAVS